MQAHATEGKALHTGSSYIVYVRVHIETFKTLLLHPLAEWVVQHFLDYFIRIFYIFCLSALEKEKTVVEYRK